MDEMDVIYEHSTNTQCTSFAFFFNYYLIKQHDDELNELSILVIYLFSYLLFFYDMLCICLLRGDYCVIMWLCKEPVHLAT